MLDVFTRALAKLTTADLFLPDGGKPDDDSLMRVRRSDWTLWAAPTDLAQRYQTACKAVHDTIVALLVLDELDAVPLPRSPSRRSRLVPLAQARMVTERLTKALHAAQGLELVVMDQEHILRSLEPLRALQGGFWSEIATTPRKCEECKRTPAAMGRRKCWPCLNRRRAA